MQPPQKQKQVADRDSAGRLGGDLAALAGSDWHRLHYGVAVSGGPDSMALLWLMASLLPGQVWAATVDHGLRKGSDEEARMVAGFCEREHIPHSTLRPPAPIRRIPAGRRTNRTLSPARTVARGQCAQPYRYRAIMPMTSSKPCVMRLNRSSGVGGLAAIRAPQRRHPAPAASLAPRAIWFMWRSNNDLPFVDDPSNSDNRFDRARLRHALQSQTALDPVAAARSAAWLAEADEALDWAVERLIASWPDASGYRGDP